MAIIELGESYAAPPADSRPRRYRPSARWPWLAAVLVLLLATVAAAGPVPRSALPGATVSARLGVDSVVEGDRLFVVDPVGATAVDNPQVAAFRLPRAEPLWREPIPIAGLPTGRVAPGRGEVTVSAAAVGDLLLLAAHSSPAESPDTPPDAPPVAVETVALDGATGAVRWRHAGYLDGVTVGGDLLLWELPTEAVGRPGTPSRLSAVAPGSGEARWSYPLPAAAERIYHYAIERAYRPARELVDRIVVRVSASQIRLLDPASGRVVRTLDLPPADPGASAEPASGVPLAGVRWSSEFAGDLLVLSDGESTVTAYGLDGPEGLDRRWTASWNPKVEFGPGTCGADLCFQGHQGGLRVLDPATGRTRWTAADWSALWTAGDYLLATRSMGLAGGPLTVLDPATGRVRGELGPWEVVGLPPDGGRPLGLRHDRWGRAWVAELDPAGLTVEVLGVLDGVSGDCRAYPGTLTCRRVDGLIGVWRLPG